MVLVMMMVMMREVEKYERLEGVVGSQYVPIIEVGLWCILMDNRPNRVAANSYQKSHANAYMYTKHILTC